MADTNMFAGRPSVWVFVGAKAGLPAAVFSSKENGEKWIAENGVSGSLSEYPLDISIYDWVQEADFFEPKRDDQRTPRFIERFTSASQPHHHYEQGKHA